MGAPVLGLRAAAVRVDVGQVDLVLAVGEVGDAVEVGRGPRLADQGRAMMDAALRLKQERGLEPKPVPLEKDRG
jgi:hypothetical protein